MSSPSSRAWCFTLNNPEEFDIDNDPPPLSSIYDEIPYLRYIVYQYELGETYTPHLQGYLELTRGCRMSQLKVGQLAFAHFEARKGPRDSARDYARKDEGRVAGPWEYGTWIGGQGTRSDLQEAATTLLASRNLRELALQHPAAYVKYHSGFARLLETTRPLPAIPEPEWRPWQAEALGLLQGDPHPRRIHWYVDPAGGTGKSFLVRYLATNRGALPLSSAKYDRLLNAWNGEPIVTFDFARDVSSGSAAGDQHGHDRTPYAVIESIKNGVVFSGMYGVGPRIFPIPHVLCFSNFEPDQSKLSADRWDVHYIFPPSP